LESESTLNTIVISGTAVQWYNSTGSLYSTPLEDGVTYYASQKKSCESTNRLPLQFRLSILYLQMIMPKCL
jgi:hypothetical protein